MSSTPPPPPLPVRYNKPWLSVSDQVAQLISRGLTVSDISAAEAFIQHTSYYRFSGYCLAFEDSRHAFTKGTTFEAIRTAYEFDAKLRDLFREATELIEVDLRSAVAHSFGKRHGAFGHIDSGNFHSNFKHAKWHQNLEQETKRSSEIFVNHFRVSYREFPDLPIWAATEVMSFGALSRMISGLWKRDRKEIANQYSLSPKQLSSIVHHFVYVRNLCAHHCRLWDRRLTIKADLPNGSEWQPPEVLSNERIWSTLLLVRWILQRNTHFSDISTQWRDKVSELVKSPPGVKDPNLQMGLPPNWEAHSIWSR